MKARQEITATVYDRKGIILSIGRNSYTKTHPQQAKFAAKAGEPEKEYLHAEIAAIIKAQKRGKPYKIKIERYSKNGEPANARPCKVCQLAIKTAGIKLVEYTV